MGVQYAHPRLIWDKKVQKTALRKDISMRGLHKSTKTLTKQNAATLRVSLVIWGAALRAPMAVGVQYAHPRLRWGMEEQKTAIHKDILMGGSLTSIKRRAKQNTATLGVSLVVLGPPWGPLWLEVSDMSILDWDEVGKSKKPLYISIFLWDGQIIPSIGGQSRSQQPQGYLWLFLACFGGSYGHWCAICPS